MSLLKRVMMIKKALINQLLESDVIDEKEDSGIIAEKEDIKEEEVNLDLKQIVVCDNKVEKKVPSPVPEGSLFLFGTMFQNHDDVKEENEEEDSKVIHKDDEVSEEVEDNETDNDVVEEIAETDISIEVIEAVSTSSEDEDRKTANDPNQEEKVLLVRDAETDIISSIETSKTSLEDCEDDSTKYNVKPCFVKCEQVQLPEDYRHLSSETTDNVESEDQSPGKIE